MKRLLLALFLVFPLLVAAQQTYGNLPPLYVDGGVLKDVHGNPVVLHGVTDVPNPQENGGRWGDEVSDANLSACTSYFTKLFTGLTKTAEGARCNAFRLQMEPAWTSDASLAPDGSPYYNIYSASKMKSYTPKLYWKLILSALRKGMYVVVQAPRQCPAQLEGGDAYQQYLIQMWDAFTQNDSIRKYAGQISLEIAPSACGVQLQSAAAAYFQPIVSQIRQNHFAGLLWIPDATGASRANGLADGPLLQTLEEWSPELEDALLQGAGTSVMLARSSQYLDLDSLMETGQVVPAPRADSSGLWAGYDRLSERYPTYRSFRRTWTADQGNGTFVNPILNGDFPDIDIIRVEDTYYLMSTTMYIFPGATIMKSKDLVNWEYCCNPLEKIDDNDAYNLLNGKDHYAQGQWATSMRYHDGQFYVYFISYGRQGVDNGRNVLLTATQAEGPWKMQYMNEHYYDSGWLFDDGPDGDGYLYVACGITNISVNKLDAKTLKKISSATVIRDKESFEGSRMYHIGKYYYIYLTTGGYWRGQTIFRSESPMGPYVECPNGNQQAGSVFSGQGIHQGGLVETQTGEWWTILFKDAGAIGRVPYLEPVEWVDGWPLIGNNGADVSKNGKAYRKPDVGTSHPRTYLPSSDSFTSLTLGKQWGWNHNHDDSKWSLLERPGHLRLHTVNVTDNLLHARNTLTQRIMGLNPEGCPANKNQSSYGTVKLDVTGMLEGDVAGLSVFQDPYHLIGVTVRDGKKRIVYMEATTDSDPQWKVTEKLGPELKSDTLYLRAIVNFSTNKSELYYGYDNAKWTKFGNALNMRFMLSIFVGQRFYLFNYATRQEGGFVDLDWFSTEVNFNEDVFYGEDVRHAYPVEEVSAVSLSAKKDEVSMMPGSFAPLQLTCTLQSGTKVDVSTACHFTVATPGIVRIQAGRLVGVGEGSTRVNATYTDALGRKVSTDFTVHVSYFPLSVDVLDPNLIGKDGTVRQNSTYTLVRTSKNGMAGWHYSEGLDLTGKGRYLVVHLNRTITSKPVLRFYDENDLTSDAFYATEPFGSDTLAVFDLEEIGTHVDLSHIYYVGFYLKTASALQLSEVFLSEDGKTPTAVEEVGEEATTQLVRVEIYSPDGRRLPALQGGINLVRRIYSDGHSETVKVSK